MIGLIDSGAGGVCTMRELHSLLPRESLLLLGDYGNAPYGKKSSRELLPIIEDGIRRMYMAGAEKVLLACCTASAHFADLSAEAQKIALPIISPTVEAALKCGEERKIAVIATELTVSTHAFGSLLGESCVAEIAAGELVLAAEGEKSPSELYNSMERVTDLASVRGADILILGCTHFHTFAKEIAEIAERKGIKKIISSAREGALELVRKIKKM